MLSEFRKESKSLKTWQKISLVLIIIGLGFFVLVHTELVSLPKIGAVDCASHSDSKIITVSVGESFVPNRINAHACDQLKFIATDDAGHWPAAGPHPTHSSYPEFDAHRSLGKGESYTLILNRVGNYSFHDHLHLELTGTLVVDK